MSRRPAKQRVAVVATLISAVAFAAFASGCSTIGYYSQAIGGHLSLMRAREPIDKLLAAEDTDPTLRKQLEVLVEARVFGVRELGLPDNDSYSSYAATGRRAVTWNVVAAPEFSLNPHLWCFPVAGCVSYRGYFDIDDARGYAEQLASEEGLDVTVGGAAAYSTLGWFDDPILDTMLRGGELRYVGTLFHELAHQVVYIQDDSDFNEAYATFVEQLGVRRWLRDRGEAERIEEYDASLARGEDFVALLGDTRAELVDLYDDAEMNDGERRRRKAEVFSVMRERYDALKVSWGDYTGYDGWFARDINNARLVAVSTYRRWVPAFAELYREASEDIERFHELVADVGELAKEPRRVRMQTLLDDARAGLQEN